MNKSFQIILTLLVFILSCWIGFSIARQKPIWGDEMVSEQQHIGSSSYWQIITGNVADGEKAPIYFCFQKFIDQVFSYKFPEAVTGSLYFDNRTQVICRSSAVLSMSLAIAIIFYYFTCSIALWAGVSALLITLSTFMVWGYWAEDRVYALWFLGTSIQSLIVLWASQCKPNKNFVLGWFLVANILLSLMTPTCVIQILAVAIWMFLAGYRKIIDYVVTLVIPLGIFSYYYHQIHLMNGDPSFYFKMPAWKIFTANIPLERCILLVAAGLTLWLRPLLAQDRKVDLNCLTYFSFIFAAGAGLLMLFKMKSSTTQLVWAMDGRYFIFLAPVGIIALTFIFTRLIQLTRLWKVKVALVLVLILLTVPRIWRYAHFSYVGGGPQYSGSLNY